MLAKTPQRRQESPKCGEHSTAHKDDLGFGLLLKKYTPNVIDATPEQIRLAADDTIPQVCAAVLGVPAHGDLGRTGS